MKISILFFENVKQIMLTPETDHEKTALKFINPEETLTVVAKRGTFSDVDKLGVEVSKCQGGYYRAYEQEDSLMFVVEPKKKESL